MKKAKKANKKASKKSSSSSSSASSAGGDNAAAQIAARALAAARERAGRGRSRSASPGLKKEEKEAKLDVSALGPNADMVNKREDYAARLADRKRQALESRGAPRRMDEE